MDRPRGTDSEIISLVQIRRRHAHIKITNMLGFTVHQMAKRRRNHVRPEPGADA